VTFELITDPAGIIPVVVTVPVPEPLTISLFCTGLAGVAAIRRRKKQTIA